MKKYLLSIVSLVLMTVHIQASTPRAPEATPSTASTPAAPPPQIEVCFVLDTTGSMSGLIEGAKQKIWSIANEMVKAKPTPEVKIGLVAYRDKGDEYVTKSFPLTTDLDSIYGELQKFVAAGGGDEPESVNEALAEAVRKMAWSQDKSTLKMIFLVGDAPPHMDYPEGPKYPNICKEAATKEILINTIQCGNITSTTPIWKEIAQLSEGRYATTSQTGSVAVIAAPQDKELAELNREIGKTLVAYGTQQEQKEVSDKQARSEASFATPAMAPAAADRLLYNSATKKTVQGGNDLVEDYDKDNAAAKNVSKEKLPEPLQKMDATELENYLKTQQAKRSELQARIDQVNHDRMTFLDAERKKLAKNGTKDSFDDQVTSILREEGAKKGIIY